MRTIHSKVVGVTRDNDDGTSRQEIINELSEYDFLVLERDPQNYYDTNAIKVLTDDNRQIGYLGQRLAEELAPLMDAGQEIECELKEVTGLDQDTQGVNIEITVYTPEETREMYEQIEQRIKQRTAAKKNIKPIKHKPQVMVINSDKSFIALVVWFALLGLVGGHRFYVGRGNWLYTLTLGFFLIGYAIDFLQIITGTFKDNHGYMIKP